MEKPESAVVFYRVTDMSANRIQIVLESESIVHASEAFDKLKAARIEHITTKKIRSK